MISRTYFLVVLGYYLFQVAYPVITSSIPNDFPPKFEYYGGKVEHGPKGSTRQLQAKLNEAAKSEYTKTGTTIVGMCCRDGIVLGADTRSTGGPLVMDKNKLKIHNVAKYIRCCAAGTSADCTQITRKAGHHLGMLRIEHELSGECSEGFAHMDPIAAAVTSISNQIRASRSDPKQQRKVESVLILGGVDHSGPALYQIDLEGVPQRVSFGALGSGATDALAVLEHERRLYRTTSRLKKAPSIVTQSQPGSVANNEYAGESTCDFDVDQAVQEGHCEDISVTDAVNIVRKAVRSGITNDLGSGSHVDLCVISFDANIVSNDVKSKFTVRQWREEAVSGWDADRLSRSIDTAGSVPDGSAMNSAGSHSACAVNTESATLGTSGPIDSPTVPPASDLPSLASKSIVLDKCGIYEDNELGKRVFSIFRPVRRLVGDTMVEELGTVPVDEMVALNVELIE